jgi:uncharacterized LabA/DUF88 family protein
LTEPSLKIAVFIDFDNIEIGVKTTLGQHFDVGTVLEAVKERGEIVTKVAYGDWTRAGDYGRTMSQHAIHMVQRNLTPGGDKNGADINLALDALEMAFTHSHINSFVIVGGDSDFISLVEKLKQYDRKVFVVGGRAFTSQVMQKNCTEFVAYENLISRGKPAARGKASGGDLTQAVPLVRRALKLLADREVLPQLGLLKSTLLQLDSAFSERDYGASSFRDFVQKLANAGHVTLKGSDRSFHVELRETAEAPAPVAPAPASVSEGPSAPAPVEESTVAAAAEALSRGRQADALRLFQQAFAQAKAAPRWPMYARQVKQLVKGVDPQFDERTYGFNGIIDALRFGQREGLFRLERDRLGVVRIFPGTALQVRQPGAGEAAGAAPVMTEASGDVAAAEAPILQDDVAAAVEGGVARAAEAFGDEVEAPAAVAASGDEAWPHEGSHSDAQPDQPAHLSEETPATEPQRAATKGHRRSRAASGAQPRARKTAGARRAPTGNTAPRRARGRKPED